MFESAWHGHVPPVDELRDLVDFVHRQRGGQAHPFEIVVGGKSPRRRGKSTRCHRPSAQGRRDLVGRRQLQSSDDLDQLTPVLRRIEQGPLQL